MANAGPDTNGSQFYITMEPAPWLDGGYNVFGHVVQGMDVVKAIKVGDHMTSVRILRVGAAAGAFTVTQKSFDALVAKAMARRGGQGRSGPAGRPCRRSRRMAEAHHHQVRSHVRGAEEGTGGSPSPARTVSVNYKGMLLDGTVFDSTEAAGEPATLQVDRVIKGWTEALLAMKRGEKRRLVIPPELAYGAQGTRASSRRTPSWCSRWSSSISERILQPVDRRGACGV